MSLNRYENLLLSYLENHPEEKRFWESQVREVAARQPSRNQAARELSAMFWEYFEERARFQSPFREVVAHEDMQRISMVNLSEYLMRMWAPPPAKPGRRA